MELRQLNTFKVVAEVRGFTRAAELLGYAQSSVTAQIQSLEEELGTPLFDRLGKKIVLTEAGVRLLPYAKEMIKLQTSAIDATKTDVIPTGTITIGAPESLAAFRLPDVIREYRSLYPQVKIILKPAPCWELRNHVRSGDLDLAFLLEPESQAPDQHIETLAHEKMALIAPLDHPLANRSHIEPDDLKGETILHTEPGCSYRELFEHYLQKHGITTDTNLEFWSIEAIKNCVMCGLGIAFLPQITVQLELNDQKFAALAFDDNGLRVATQLLYHKGKWISPAVREFLRVVHEHAARW